MQTRAHYTHTASPSPPSLEASTALWWERGPGSFWLLHFLVLQGYSPLVFLHAPATQTDHCHQFSRFVFTWQKPHCNLLLTLSCLLLRTRYLNKSRWRFLIAAWERLKMVSMLPKTLKQKITTWSCCPSLIVDKLDQLENERQLRRIYNSCTSLRD